MTDVLAPCYASSAKQYRHQMGGAPDAANLPAPTDQGIDKWENVAKSFDNMVTEIQDALRAAEAAHEGRAADAANASIAEITPHATAAAETSRGVKGALVEQVGYQKDAFNALPAQGDKLENGNDVQLDPPEKGWVEEGGWDQTWYLGWASDYEERQQDFVSTNERANAAMERYQGQTDGVIARMPEFKPVEQPPPPPQQPPGSGMQSADSHLSGTSMSSPSSTSSAWAGGSGSSGGGSHVPTPSHSPAPAASQSQWANPALPPGTVRGPDGTMYRQGPNGWERQNPYNGRWAPSPQGGPGGNGGGRGGGMAGGRGGGMGGGGRGGGQLGAGGRAGVGGLGGGSAASGGAAGGAGGRGGAPMGGAGGAGRGNQQEGEEQEHSRPSWLTEAEDVFTNDLERVAPPVFGDTSPGGKG